MADGVAIGLRALAAAAALLAAGLPIFVFLHGRLLDRTLLPIRSTTRPTALIALALVILHAVIEPVRLAGAWSGALDPSLHALLLSTDFGTTLAIRTLGLILIAGSSWNAGRPGTVTALVGATLVAISFTLMGHTAADPERWLLAPLLLVHLLAIAFWFGSLWPLLAVTRIETPAIAGTVIRRFSQTAFCVVPVILLAGLAMSVLLLPELAALSSPYGIALITKLGGFAALMALAAWNKWRLSGGVEQGNRTSLLAFQTSVRLEWILILAVVTVTAVMTAMFSPEH